MLASTLALLVLAVPDDPSPTRHPGERAPAGVPDVRGSPLGAWSFSLRSSYTRFEGLLEESRKISTDEALGLGYAQVPESMESSSTAFELLYAASDVLTLHASALWITNSARMVTDLGESFRLDSSGLGDTQVGADLLVWQLGEQSVWGGISVGIPTGSITETGGRPGAPPTRLEYPLQLGSGTWDLSGRLDWRMRTDPYSYGIELAGTTRIDHNDEQYALGDCFRASAWGAQEWNSSLSGSLRISAARRGNVRGADPELDPQLSPTHDGQKQGGQRVDGALGINWMPFKGGLSGSVVGLEVGIPLAQDLYGPQLSADWFAALHVGISF